MKHTLLASAFALLLSGLCTDGTAQSRRDKEQTYVMENPYEVVKVTPPTGKKVKNVILMIGDGMSLMHVYSAWTANRGKLNLDNCQSVGLSKTYCADRLITDSGAGGTALATGRKTNYHYVGVDTDGKPLKTLTDLAAERGKATGVVVTCRLNDATPADFCCHNTDRDADYDIVADYVNCGVDFVFGGGSKYFENRPDGRDIFKELQQKGYQTPRSWEELDKVRSGKVFTVTDTTDTPVPAVRGDLLARASMKAIDMLSRDSDGFFLMIEGSQLDDYGHFNDLDLLMQETHDFDRTIGSVYEWAARDGETLVIVTADHETGGLTLIDGDKEQGRIVGKFSTGGHSGVMVPVYSFGPGAERFTGIFENSDLYGKIETLIAPERDVTVVVAGDLHFDLLPETDQYYHVRAMNHLEGNFTFPKNAPAGIAGTVLSKLDGVIIAGDMFDKARPEILNLYRTRYEGADASGQERTADGKSLRYPVYPGFGNHDIDPTSSDSLQNLTDRAFNFAYLDSALSRKLERKEIHNLHTGSRSYSWNVGDVHFIQAQRFAGDTSYSESNFDWLEADLKQYASSGNPVVYIQHYGVDPWAAKWWPQAARNRLFDLLDRYNVAAFLVGHTHAPSVEYYRGYPIYQVNNAWPDEDGNGSFAVLRIKGDAVSVSSCRWTDGEGRFETASPLQSGLLPLAINRKIHYNAFSHNDYWRENPLHDALAFRYNCVEADLWEIDGELYVSHDRPEPDPAITFENLYLRPLAARIAANGGKVFPDGDRPFYLMADCKTDGEKMYPLLKKQMEPYKELFCSLQEGTYREGAVLFFLSGARPKKTVTAEQTRFTFLDGQVKDLGKGIPATLAPVISDNYRDFFTWNGEGEMPADQLQRLRDIITRVHAEGKLFRWWGAPDNETFKRFFLREGVDLVGADDLSGLFNVL